MKSSFGIFFRTHKRTLTALFFGLAFSTSLAYAVPPTTAYQPGAVLDPTCAPGDTNCTVTLFPDQTGNTGKYLTTDGSVVSWATVVSGGSATNITALTIGTSGTDITSTVDNTDPINPIVTLNIPDASYTARGVVTTGAQTFSGIKSFQGNTGTDTAPAVVELIPTGAWTSSGWTGDNTVGFTHTTGNTTSLMNSITPTIGQTYRISVTVTNRTTGTFNVSLGGVSSWYNSNADFDFGVNAISTAGLSIIPSSTFNGTVVVSVIRVSNPITNWKSSNGTTTIELRGNSSGGNVAFGEQSGISLSTGLFNTFYGTRSGLKNSTGSFNVFVGGEAGAKSNASYNTFVGEGAGYLATGGTNTFYGAFSGKIVSTGVGNTILGYNTAQALTTGSYNTIIGSSIGVIPAGLSNNVIIADGQGNQRIKVDNTGKVSFGGYGTGTKTGTATYNLAVDTSGNIIEVAAGGGGAAWGSISGTLSSQTDVQNALNAKQATLVSGTNIKTVNGNSLLGSGDVLITPSQWVTSGNNISYTTGSVGIGTSTGTSSRLDIMDTSKLSGMTSYIASTQTQVNTGDTGDGTFLLGHTLSATSTSNELVTRVFALGTTNNLTGGGAISNMRVFNMANNTMAGSITTNLDAIYIENGSSVAGTVVNSRAIRIKSMQGTSQAALAINALGGTNHTYALLGTDAIPLGQYGVYEVTGNQNYFSSNTSIGSTLAPSLFNVGYGNEFQINASGAIVAATGITSSGTITFSDYGAGGNTGTATYTLAVDSIGNVIEMSTPITIQNTSSLFTTGLPGAGAGSIAVESIFFGTDAGNSATNAYSSNFLGSSAGQNATNAYYSNFFGLNAGLSASGANFSNFLGSSAGNGATDAGYSNFFGNSAGQDATDAGYSNFFGANAGQDATMAYGSNFLGNSAGQNATNANDSNFIGNNTGGGSTNANGSNFMGSNAGNNAVNASYSGFFGTASGQNALNASLSSFIGMNTGNGATNAANSIFIGTNAGLNDSANNTAVYDDITTFANTSILIGHLTSTAGFSNSIALGAYATNTATNQMMVGSTNRRIENLVFNGGTGNTCSISTATGITCSSDERLKTNIEDIDSALEKLSSLRTVTYNWKSNPEGDRMIGFIAQNLESQFPELVTQNIDGMLSVNYAQITPVLVKAIQEMDVKITSINDLATPNTFRESIIAWLADVGNGIGSIFSKKVMTEELCLKDAEGETCYSRSELNTLFANPRNTPTANDETTSSESIEPESTIPENSDPIEVPESIDPVEVPTDNIPVAPPETPIELIVPQEPQDIPVSSSTE